MELTFFGQYLVNHGLINTRQLSEALTVVTERNQLVGSLAVQGGYLTDPQVEEIHREQRRADKYFGEIAAERGWMTTEQVDTLLGHQRNLNVRIGDILVELGYADRRRIETMHQRFLADQAEHLTEHRLPSAVAQAPLTRYALDLFPRLLRRITTQPSKLGRGVSWTCRRGASHAMSIGLTGEVDLTTTLVPSERQAKELSAGILGLVPSERSVLDQDQIADALSEFMNMYADAVKHRANEMDVDLNVGVPLPGRLPAKGFSFPVLTNAGAGSIVVRTSK